MVRRARPMLVQLPLRAMARRPAQPALVSLAAYSYAGATGGYVAWRFL